VRWCCPEEAVRPNPNSASVRCRVPCARLWGGRPPACLLACPHKAARACPARLAWACACLASALSRGGHASVHGPGCVVATAATVGVGVGMDMGCVGAWGCGWACLCACGSSTQRVCMFVCVRVKHVYRCMFVWVGVGRWAGGHALQSRARAVGPHASMFCGQGRTCSQWSRRSCSPEVSGLGLHASLLEMLRAAAVPPLALMTKGRKHS